jgi:hypothetical protein
LPPGMQKPQSIKNFNDPESNHVAFANNAVFWLAYSCLECASVNKESMTELALEFQKMGIQAIKKVFEESEFLKMLIGVTKLSPNFY